VVLFGLNVNFLKLLNECHPILIVWDKVSGKLWMVARKGCGGAKADIAAAALRTRSET